MTRREEYRLLSWWLLALILATAQWKAIWLDSAYRGDGWLVVVHALTPGGVIPDRVWALLFFAVDALEATLWVAVLYGLFCRALGLRLPVVILVANAVTLLTVGASMISLNELQTLLTTDSLVTAMRWMASHPALLRTYLTLDTGLLVALGLAWAVAPLAVHAVVERLHRATGVARALAPIAAGCVLLSGGAWLFALWLFPGNPVPLHGYWSSSVRTFFAWDRTVAAAANPPPISVLRERWNALVYPEGRPADPRPLLRPEPPDARRHVLIVSLETAPRRFYPLDDDPSLPVFHALSQRSLVSARHYANSPFTSLANFTILTGVYPTRSGRMALRGAFHTDGLASVLGARGWETTYIDSMQVDWHPGQGNRETVRQLGFDHLFDHPEYEAEASFEVLLANERRSLERALAAITDAEQRGRSALVHVDTILGHYPWKAPRGEEDLSAERRLHGLALAFDGLIGEVLGTLRERGLDRRIVLIVTGDHGLRYRLEYESVGLDRATLDVAFNVPLLVHAPGLLPDRRIELPWPTSHADLTPTVLALLGVDTAGMLHHGEPVWNGRLAERVVFLLNGRLSPEDAWLWRGHFVRYHALTGRATRASHADERDATAFSAVGLPAALHDPARLLAEAYLRMEQTETTQVRAGASLSRPPPPERSSPGSPE